MIEVIGSLDAGLFLGEAVERRGGMVCYDVIMVCGVDGSGNGLVYWWEARGE